MKHVIEVIEARRRRYQEHPYIQYMLDERRTPQERLAYAPFACHFVLTFSDFNRYYLHSRGAGGDTHGRRPASEQEKHQAAVDEHAREDGRHFGWFLQDLGTLGYDTSHRLSDTLRFLWSDLGRGARDLGYFAIAAVSNADAKSRLAVIEAVEAMGNVWLEATLVAARQHPAYDKLIYFGQHHLDRETGHAIGSDHAATGAIELGSERVDRLMPVIHGLFDRMEAFSTELVERGLASYAGGQAERGEPIDFMRY